MPRRHPVLRGIAGGYLVALAVLCLTPNGLVARGVAAIRSVAPEMPEAGVEVVIDALLFVPVGVLLMIIAGRRRWLAVVIFGIVASCWLQLAQTVWLPQQNQARVVVAHMAGTLAGIAAVLSVLAMRKGSRPSENDAASPPSRLR